MKKLFALITVLCVIFSMVGAYAQTYTSNELGVAFIMSDDWRLSDQSNMEILFDHKWSSNEHMSVIATPIENAYDIDILGEELVAAYCKETYSDQAVAQRLNEANNISGVRVKTHSEQSSYVVFGGTKYYRYEKAYTASAYGYYDQGFYDTIFITARNGRIYEIVYGRDDDLYENHFADVRSMLDSMSYAEGETKIYVNGERVIADSAPMIILGRTLVPIRAIAEKMGYSVGWNDSAQTATLIGKHNLAFTINSTTALRDFNEFTLDVPAITYNSRTYLPLRAVAEAMDARVDWNEYENAVYITSNGY